MEVNEEPVEPIEDVQASTSKDQQESALTSWQAFSHSGGKATGLPLSQRFGKVSGLELGTLSFSLSRFPSYGTLVFPWPGMNFLLNPCLFLIMPPSHAYHTLCVSKREKKTLMV